MSVPDPECAVCASVDAGRAGSRCVALSEHWHVLLCAKPAQIGESSAGAALVVDREQYRDDVTAARVADVELMLLPGWPAVVGGSAERSG
jgi:hypothetical protein